MHNEGLRSFIIAFNCFSIVFTGWHAYIYIPKNKEDWRKLNSSGRFLNLTLALNFLGQVASLPPLILRCLRNYPYDIPLDEWIIILTNALNCLFAMGADLFLVFTSITRLESMQLVFKLTDNTKRVLLVSRYIISFLMFCSMIAASYPKYGPWR